MNFLESNVIVYNVMSDDTCGNWATIGQNYAIRDIKFAETGSKNWRSAIKETLFMRF